MSFDSCVVRSLARKPNFYLRKIPEDVWRLRFACMYDIQVFAALFTERICLSESVRLKIADTSKPRRRLTGDKIGVLPHWDNTRIARTSSQEDG